MRLFQYHNHYYYLAKEVELMRTAIRKETLPISVEDAFQAALDAVKSSGWRVIEAKANEIKAETRISMKSWGEIIAIKIFSEATGTTIAVSSKPIQSPALVDWGKNSENLKDFFSQFTLKVLKLHLLSKIS